MALNGVASRHKPIPFIIIHHSGVNKLDGGILFRSDPLAFSPRPRPDIVQFCRIFKYLIKSVLSALVKLRFVISKVLSIFFPVNCSVRRPGIFHFISFNVTAPLLGCRSVKEKNRAREHNGSDGGEAEWPFATC